MTKGTYSFSFFSLVFILFIAVFIRCIDLSSNPAGFFCDEASNGLEAYHILKEGTDTYDRPYPLFFEALGDYKDPVYIYSLVPIMALFGPSEFAVRFLSALYGVGAVLMMYFMVRQIASEKVALLSALFLAVSPWHIHMSRAGFQLISTIFWLECSLYFLLKSMKHARWYPAAAVSLFFTFFSYSAIKMYFLPLILIGFFVFRNEQKKLFKSPVFWISNVFITVIFALAILPYIKEGTFFARWKQVYEVYDIALWKIIKSYGNHFSLDFLFLKGDAGIPEQAVKRHSIIGVGELYLMQLPFILWGIGASIREKVYRPLLFFLGLLFIYPLGSIFTAVEAQATRSVIGVIPFQIFTAIGLVEAASYFGKGAQRKRLFSACIALLFSLSVIHGFRSLKENPLYTSGYWGWQYGFKEAYFKLKQQENSYDSLFITHRFNMGQSLLDFYNLENPCSKCALIQNPIKISAKRKELYVLRPEDIEEAQIIYPEYQFVVQSKIALPNGEVELYIGEFAPITVF